MMEAIVAGPDEDDIGDALEAEGIALERVTGIVSRPALENAGIVEADLYVLTDAEQATSIPIARDLNEDVRLVAYARDTLPEFVKGQLDLAIDPRLMDVQVVAEELVS